MWQFDDSSSLAGDESISSKKDNTLGQIIALETNNSLSLCYTTVILTKPT